MKATSENIFFSASAIWFLLIVFAGFAPSFYLLNLYEDPEPVPTHLVIHGVVYSIWVLLYAVQVFLIRCKNYRLHKILGVFGLLVMILMVPTGMFPVVFKAYSGGTTIDAAGHNVSRFLFCYLFFAIAFYQRKQPFLHKRYMLACMNMLMGAAIFRVSMDLGLVESQLFNKGLQVLPAVALFVFDLIKYKKVVLVDLTSVAAILSIFLWQIISGYLLPAKYL
ncbi:MAG: hypothetical protein ABJG47_20010 [Ekhidna sp.]